MSILNDNPISPIEGTEELKKAYEILQKRNKTFRTFVPLHLDQSAVYIFNKYEVNDMLAVYLGLWSCNPELDHVPLDRLISHFPDEYSGLLKSFFSNPRILCSDYIVFVCFFVFYDVPQIVPVFLTMSHILSNVFVSQEQLYSFFTKFGLNKDDYNDLSPLLKESTYEVEDCPTNAFSVKIFEHYLKTNFAFTSYIYKLKSFLLDYCIDPSSVFLIQERRKFYYNHNIDDISVIEKPKESCCNKSYRYIFTSRPEPYHYDYAIRNITEEKAKDEVVFMIKKRFGYSMRGSSLLNWNPISRVRANSHFTARTPTSTRKHANSYAIGPNIEIKINKINNFNNNNNNNNNNHVIVNSSRNGNNNNNNSNSNTTNNATIDDKSGSSEKKRIRKNRSLNIETGPYKNLFAPLKSPIFNRTSVNEVVNPHKISVEPRLSSNKIFPM